MLYFIAAELSTSLRGPLDTFSLFMDPCLQFKGVVFRLSFVVMVIAVTVEARVREEFSALLTQHA